jgi:hypothetical protein
VLCCESATYACLPDGWLLMTIVARAGGTVGARERRIHGRVCLGGTHAGIHIIAWPEACRV